MDQATAPAANVSLLTRRFRGYLPVVVDVETGGFDWNRHALLEIAAVPLDVDEHGALVLGEATSAHVVPAPGTDIDPQSLEVTGIDIDHPFRFATPEREALASLLDLGLHDSFRLFEADAGHYSWWDYRLAAFQRGWGLRIDLALVSEALRGSCTAAGIDSGPRGWERPSDHTPVWVDIEA